MSRVAVFTLAASLLAAACDPGARSFEDVPDEIQVESPAFPDGAAVPRVHTCDGGDAPPVLSWRGGPDAAEYALVVSDVDAGGFVHWTVYGIPASTSRLSPEGLPSAAEEGANDFNRLGYGGPCPPPGDGPHRYEFVVYALTSEVNDRLRPGATSTEVLRVIECCLRAKGTLLGTYER